MAATLPGAFGPTGGGSPWLGGMAIAVGFPLAGYLLRDAVYGSRHAATLVSALPQRGARVAVAGLLGAALAVGAMFVAWLAIQGGAPDTPGGVRAVYGVLLAFGAVLLGFNLDGWIVSGGKAAYLVWHGSGWLLLGLTRAVLAIPERMILLTMRLAPNAQGRGRSGELDRG